MRARGPSRTGFSCRYSLITCHSSLVTSSGQTAATHRSVNLSGRITGIVSGKLDVNGSELDRLTGTTEWSLAAELFQFFPCRTAADLQGSPDRSGRDAVHANPLRRELFRERTHITRSRGLRHRVIINLRGRLGRLFRSSADNH